MRRIVIYLALPIALLLTGLVPPASAYQISQDSVVRVNPAGFTPNVLDGEVDTIAQVGRWIVLGGSFTQVQAASGGPILTRNHILAFDKDTGEISSSFAPSMSSDVKSLATGPNGTVYAGGSFSSVNGTRAYKIAQLDVTTGSLVSAFKPKTVNAIVRDVRYVGGRLFIGGEFTSVGGVSRHRLAELNPTTGALLPLDVPLEGTHFAGKTQIYHMDINPTATTMVLAGNFTSVGGQPRTELAMIDLTSGTVSSWQTSRFETRCYDVFHFIVRDVEFSPDGAYFVVGTTGGYGSGSPSMCDSISRWETDASGPGQNPTWIDYTGGDSTYTTTITGTAVYIGGHERWVNNPGARDAQGPGAVARQGIAALDPVNGLPLTWNPGRVRGQGVFAMLATTEGLFVGSDTDQIHGEYHAKIAFFPLAGGTTVPQPVAPSLPVNIYSLGDLSSARTNVLYRVNAGGGLVSSLDAGPDWMDDSGDTSSVRNSGSRTGTSGSVPNVNASVPSTTPSKIFDSERYDPAGGNEMRWAFPVPAGKHVQVRLYFANRCSCTSAVGQRKFNVDIDGQRKLSNFDVVADAGDQTGEMKSFAITSDGVVNIDFGHVVENPMIDGIEILDSDAASTGADQGVMSREYDGTTVGAPSSLSTGGYDWSNALGAFLAGNDLYTAWSDGHLYKRSFDGTNFGAPQDVDLNGLTNFSSEMRSMTGLFYTNGRIYYTLAGSSALYMRYFTVESDTVGAGLKELQPFKVADKLPDVDWSQVRGMTFAGGKLYYANRQTGTLNRVDWVNGAPVAGTNTVVSGPALDGVRWAQKALFVSQAVPNQAPVARMSVHCTKLTCAFDGTQSSDAEGPVSYRWDFGDGASSTAPAPAHDYSSPDTYHVTLSVTDGDGAVGTTDQQVEVIGNQPPTAAFTSTCTAFTCHFDSSGSSDPDGTLTGWHWDFGDGGTSDQANPDHSFTAGSNQVTLTVTDDENATGQVTHQLNLSASEVSFVDSAAGTQAGSTRTHSTEVPNDVQQGDTMMLYLTDNAPDVAVTGPAGWTQVASTTTSGMLTRIWSRQATASDPGATVPVITDTAVKGVLALTAYRDAAPVSAADVQLAEENTRRADHTTPEATIAGSGAWVASLWADKTASTTTWATPDGQVQRQLLVDTGSGHPSMLVTDTGASVPAGSWPGVTATADSTSLNATMGTVVLRPAG